MTFGRKYVVVKRDGSIPSWPLFVLGAADRAAPAALRTYATMAKALGVEQDYIDSVMEHAQVFNDWRDNPSNVDPDLDFADVLVIARGLLSELTATQRTEVFNHLRKRWCIDCGNEECICNANEVVPVVRE
jgi:hypothetical protein